MPIILGIDPGLQKTGWGVIVSEGSRLKFVACGMVKSTPKAPLAERLMALHEGIKSVVECYQPDTAAIEETFLNANARSSLALGHARGVLMMTASLCDVGVSEYAATLVKKSIVGVGRAEKGQVKMMVQQLLPQAEIQTEDEADALAIAICHANHMHTQQFVGALS